MSDELVELQHLLNNLPQAKIDQATYDLHFDWHNINTLQSGQVNVLLRRLRRVSRKTLDEMQRDAENSDIIRSMQKSLKLLQNKLRKYE